MLAAAHRVRRSADFRAAMRGLRSARPRVVVHVHPGVPGRQGQSRVGFVVSRAVGPAVVRNTVKRRLRHLMRERLDHVPPGTVIVVRALPSAAGASSVDLAADLDAALSQLAPRLSESGVVS